jgi:hypothetical protein
MDLAVSLRVCVMNGLFSMGIMKVGEAQVGEMDFFGTNVSIGQPFAEPVDLDDWVHDMTAKRWDQCSYMGNRYRVPYEEARDNPNFDPEARARLSPQTRFAYNERGDVRTQTLSQSTMQFYDEYEDHVELWDIWLPKEKLVLVMPYQESVEGGFSNVKPLKVIQWNGPRKGPFVQLSYCDVPNNVMPAAPLQALRDLHDLVNTLWRKLARQGERQKSIMAVMGSATDDAERINRSSDGDAVRVDMPDKCKEMLWGGMRSENIVATEQAKNLFVYMAGNLDALGGLSPQAQTLGQDELLNKNSMAQIAEMQDRTVNFTKEVYQRMGQLWWTNPVLTYETSRNVAGMDIPVSITPQMRQIPWEKLDFDIDPYSMQHDTPATRAAKLVQRLQTLIMPALGQMAQQGVTLKWPTILEILSKYDNMPDLVDILNIGPPPQMQGIQSQPDSEAPHMPAVTHRTNTRVSRPGMTREGQGQVLAQLLQGGGQPKQGAMLGAPNG